MRDGRAFGRREIRFRTCPQAVARRLGFGCAFRWGYGSVAEPMDVHSDATATRRMATGVIIQTDPAPVWFAPYSNDSTADIQERSVPVTSGVRHRCARTQAFREGPPGASAMGESVGAITKEAGITTLAVSGRAVRARDRIGPDRPQPPLHWPEPMWIGPLAGFGWLTSGGGASSPSTFPPRSGATVARASLGDSFPLHERYPGTPRDAPASSAG